MVEYAWRTVVEFWATVAEMSPYLLFGFFVAGLLSVLVSQSFVERHLGGRGLWPLLKASVFGVPLPLCSCGVIPVSMSLHRHGASRGATVAFLLSTPQTGVDSIFVTLSLLGPIFAVFRPLAAFATGIVGGSLVDALTGKPGGENKQGERCTEECCQTEGRAGRFSRGMKYGFVTLPRDIGKAMLVGIAVAALISAFVPDNYFADKLGKGIFAMVVMMFLGIPVYVCATASVPVAAALIFTGGLSPGAALVFLMTGPATNAASFATIWKTLGRRTALAYIATVAVCALASGLLLDYFAEGVEFAVAARPGWMLPSGIKYASAIILLAVLGYAIVGKALFKRDEHKQSAAESSS